MKDRIIGKEITEWITRGKFEPNISSIDNIKYFSISPDIEKLNENLWQSLRDFIKENSSSTN